MQSAPSGFVLASCFISSLSNLKVCCMNMVRDSFFTLHLNSVLSNITVINMWSVVV